jgi:hypothetical protein
MRSLAGMPTRAGLHFLPPHGHHLACPCAACAVEQLQRIAWL